MIRNPVFCLLDWVLLFSFEVVVTETLLNISWCFCSSCCYLPTALFIFLVFLWVLGKTCCYSGPFLLHKTSNKFCQLKVSRLIFCLIWQRSSLMFYGCCRSCHFASQSSLKNVNISWAQSLVICESCWKAVASCLSFSMLQIPAASRSVSALILKIQSSLIAVLTLRMLLCSVCNQLLKHPSFEIPGDRHCQPDSLFHPVTFHENMEAWNVIVCNTSCSTWELFVSLFASTVVYEMLATGVLFLLMRKNTSSAASWSSVVK